MGDSETEVIRIFTHRKARPTIKVVYNWDPGAQEYTTDLCSESNITRLTDSAICVRTCGWSITLACE